MTNNDKNQMDLFQKEIEMLIANRRKANKYDTEITKDTIFNRKSVEILHKYTPTIKNLELFKDALSFWINMMAESNEVEDYIINGMDGVLGTLAFDIIFIKSQSGGGK